MPICEQSLSSNKYNKYLSEEGMARTAIEESLKDIELLVKDGIFAKPEMFVAIAKVITLPNGAKSFEIIDYYDGFSNVDGWKYRYDEFAMYKLAVSARTGMSSGDAIKFDQESAEVLEDDEIPGETIFPGSVIDGNVMAVCSSTDGVGDKDEIVSQIILKRYLNLIHAS